MTEQEHVAMLNEMFSGRRVTRIELHPSGEYMRWYFDNGSYHEWHVSLNRGSSVGSSAPMTDGRLFKED